MSTGPDASGATIRAEGISKHYGEFVALHDISFEVMPGTVAAFLGPNGAGKSTTMKILTGYLAPTRGSVRMLGMDPGDPEQRRKMASRLGYLPENGPLYGDMSPAELLAFFAEVRAVEKASSAMERVVEQCSLSEVLHKPIHKLSKGFRQRVGMAQALLPDPEVLILDEPTSGLDPLQIRDVRALIRKLGETKTILLSTHILSEVEAVADQVIMVAEGRVVFGGTVEELRGDEGLDERFYALAQAAKEVA